VLFPSIFHFVRAAQVSVGCYSAAALAATVIAAVTATAAAAPSALAAATFLAIPADLLLLVSIFMLKYVQKSIFMQLLYSHCSFYCCYQHC
jgi:hypothetical protein